MADDASPNNRPISGILALGYMATGIGFFLLGLQELKAYRARMAAAAGTAGLGRVVKGRVVGRGGALGETLADAAERGSGAISKSKMFNVHTIEQRVGHIKKLIQQGAVDPKIIETVRAVISQKTESGNWKLAPKDYTGEARELFKAVTDPRSPYAARYSRDHHQVDTFVKASTTQQLRSGDCLPWNTLLLTPGGFKRLDELKVGDTVMGEGTWTKVLRIFDKGVLPTLTFDLSTGSRFTATADHGLYQVPSAKNGIPGERADAIHHLAGAAAEGMHLLTPASLPQGHERLDSEMAWLLGVFVADGWVDYGNANITRCAISGKDGHPKEAQKRRVKEICDARGIETRWHERYIAVNDETTAKWLAACGRGALEKHLPTIDFDADTARQVLLGLQADASISKSGTVTYNTVSPLLALQIRVLHRMLGERVNIHRVDDHGGLGTHPIYRASVIRPERADGRRAAPFAIIKSIQDGEDLPVGDIETESHRFYLPEHDIVVSNCDDLTIYLGALLAANGAKPEMVVIQAGNAPDWSHIFLRTPRSGSDGVNHANPSDNDPTDYIVLDPSMADKAPGWEPPGLTQVLRTGQPSGIVKKARIFPVYP